MTKNSTIPAIRFKGFTAPWEQRKFEEIAVRSSSISSNASLPRVEYEDIVSGTGQLNKDIYAKDSHKPGLAFHPGDILYGKLRPYLQNWLLPAFNGLAVGDFWVLKPQNTDSRFLYCLIQIRQFDEVANQSTGTKMPRADWKLVSKTIFSIPSSTREQATIGAYFAALDTLITLHQRKSEKLLTIKKSMLEKMFPQKGSCYPEIRFKGFTAPWEQRKLEELGEIMTGSTPSTSKSEYYSEDGIPWVTPTDITSLTISDTQRKLSEKGMKAGRVVPANTILCTCIASIGKNALLTIKGSFNQQINSLTPTDENDAYFLLTESELWSSKMKRIAASGTMQIVKKTDFSELTTMVPVVGEQRKIGNYFSSLDTLITLHQRKLEKLQNIKKSMLEKMFV